MNDEKEENRPISISRTPKKPSGEYLSEQGNITQIHVKMKHNTPEDYSTQPLPHGGGSSSENRNYSIATNLNSTNSRSIDAHKQQVYPPRNANTNNIDQLISAGNRQEANSILGLTNLRDQQNIGQCIDPQKKIGTNEFKIKSEAENNSLLNNENCDGEFNKAKHKVFWEP